MNVNKMAAQDAAKWAAAQMAYGEGAGTRRKLMEASIATRVERLNGYHEAFEKAYDKLDMDKFAKAAIKERKMYDRGFYLGKNLRAIVRGDIRNVSPSFLVLIVGGYYAHKFEYDKRVWEALQVEYRVLRTRYSSRYDTWCERQGIRREADVVDIKKPYGGL